MSYRFAERRPETGDLASGLVLRSAPGLPAFPVRLAEELFLRAAAHLSAREPLVLWDPCCGSGYLATVLGLLQRNRLRRVLGTDVDPLSVEVAGQNLALLSAAGLEARRAQLRDRATRFGKPGYEDAALAAERLALLLASTGGDLAARAAAADGTDVEQLGTVLAGERPDVVLTDMPYGRQTSWQGSASNADEPLVALARALCAVLPDHAVLVFCAQARRVSLGEGVPALERLRVGNRAAYLGRVGTVRATL